MKLKTQTIEGTEYAVTQDGKPVYTNKDGSDVPIDVVHTVNTVSRLNGEAKGHREAKEALEARLAAFDGIDDPAAAKTALDTVKNFDDKKLVDAGEVERIKAEIIKAAKSEYEPVVAERDDLKGQLRKEIIGGSFSRSKYVQDNLAIPPDFVESRFGSSFSLEDGKVVATDTTGNKIYSQTNLGELASFDEALGILVNNYSHKESILKSTGASGSGVEDASGSNGGNGGQLRGANDKTSRLNAIGAKFPNLPVS